MNLDIKKLAEHLAHTAFQVEAVYYCVLEQDMKYEGFTQPFPGFLFTLYGRGEIVFNGTAYVLSQGNIVHGGAKMDMEYRALDQSKWGYLLVLYRIADEYPAELSLPSLHFQIQTNESPRMSELLKQLYRASSIPGGIHAFRTETLFRCVLDEMFLTVRKLKSDTAAELFEQISQYIQEHYMDILTVSGLAKQYDVNENRLSYLFHKYVGMGPGDYIITYRLNRAKELLLNMNVPIYTVATGVGYSDQYYFSRIFKKQFGCSPSQFREEFKNNPL